MISTMMMMTIMMMTIMTMTIMIMMLLSTWVAVFMLAFEFELDTLVELARSLIH